MRSFIVMILGFALLSSCNNNNNTGSQSDMDSSQHQVEVIEALNAGAYTYLKVSEKKHEYWIAVNSRDARAGDIFYFSESLEMTNFKSKELDRVFDRILFVDKLSTVPILSNMPVKTSHSASGKKPAQMMDNIEVEPIEGSITIAGLYKNPNNYEGKKVLVRGKVVKVNNTIMNRNWVHLQDGTNEAGKFDLTITTQEEVNLGDVVTFEGLVALNKDFGAGYSYELIVEDALLK